MIFVSSTMILGLGIRLRTYEENLMSPRVEGVSFQFKTFNGIRDAILLYFYFKPLSDTFSN